MSKNLRQRILSIVGRFTHNRDNPRVFEGPDVLKMPGLDRYMQDHGRVAVQLEPDSADVTVDLERAAELPADQFETAVAGLRARGPEILSAVRGFVRTESRRFLDGDASPAAFASGLTVNSLSLREDGGYTFVFDSEYLGGHQFVVEGSIAKGPARVERFR